MSNEKNGAPALRINKTIMELVKRWTLFIIALFLMGLGVSLITKAELGTSPISGIALVLSYIYPHSLGEFTFYVSALFLVLECVVLWSRFKPAVLLQAVVGPVFGLFIDLSMVALRGLSAERYAGSVLILLVGCVTLAAGIFLQVKADVLMNPGEGLVKAIAGRYGVAFGSVKMAFDAALVMAAVVVSLAAFGSVRGIREGTVVSAFLVGCLVKRIDGAHRRLAARARVEARGRGAA